MNIFFKVAQRELLSESTKIKILTYSIFLPPILPIYIGYLFPNGSVLVLSAFAGAGEGAPNMMAICEEAPS